ncbi:MAG: nitroreductase family protein [Anaerolineales bacterium]|nr:nitroreductase family protein [Anaerolineales bacterium]
MNAVIDCLMNHRSIRKFLDKPIEPEILDTILQAGTRAATAGNLQHYSLIVVDDKEKKRALWDDEMLDAPALIIAVVDEYRLKRWFELNEAPFYFDQVTNLLIGYWDAVIALQNVVVAAESLGLGTVYLGEIISKDLAGILGTPPYVFPAGCVVVGYPDESPELRPRLPMDAVVHRNGYHLPSDDEINTWFKQKDERWLGLSEQARQKFIEQGITNWAQRTTLGHYTAEFIAEDSAGVFRNLSAAQFKLTREK